MEMDVLFKIFQSEMTSEKIRQITREQIDKTYTFLHQNYMSYLDQLGNRPNSVEDFFSWTSKSLDINIIYYTKDQQTKSFFFLSKTKENGTILLHDFIEKNLPYEVLQLYAPDFVSYLIQEGLLLLKPDNIIDSSFIPEGCILYDLGKIFFRSEYNNHLKPQLINTFERIPFNSLRIHKDIYNFTEMIRIIDNDQFTLELEECLEVYENENFFVCAAGLGSVLEHLLFLSIEKHVKPNNINENSTAADFIGQLKKHPFNINKREVSHLKNIFGYRNSVSHFNKGIFSKEMCDHLLGGIKMAFDNYYLFENRVEWK